ncbi:hypothetical protein LCGC14_1763430 [marine sediment metagenome]|uniref:Uncharacterized protein n=1 Tax=marine sediment metagenome TaxID=412755 RepID=A0A0F9H0C2_9ZZZZ
MTTDFTALALIFQLCLGKPACKIEPVQPPCVVKVSTYKPVPRTGPDWAKPMDQFMMVLDKGMIVNICAKKEEVTE